MKKRLSIVAVVLVLYLGATGVYAQMAMMGGPEPGMKEIFQWLMGKDITVVVPAKRPEIDSALLSEGKQVYERYCASCHGYNGDGKGSYAFRLKSKPRDFTIGVFKFRSTPSGSLPTDEDLFMTISKGIRGTAMLPWVNLTDRQKWAVIAYIKQFSERFEEEIPERPIRIPDVLEDKSGLLRQGQKVYEIAGCIECHGREGRGDGPKSLSLRDDWGYPVRPRDFVNGKFKRGSSLQDIYLTVATGLDGTPMPSHKDVLTEQQILAVAAYVRAMVKNTFAGVGNINRDERIGMMVYHMGGRGCMMMR